MDHIFGMSRDCFRRVSKSTPLALEAIYGPAPDEERAALRRGNIERSARSPWRLRNSAVPRSWKQQLWN